MLEKQADRSGIVSDQLFFYRSKIAYDDAIKDEKDAPKADGVYHE